MSSDRSIERVLITGGAGFLASHVCDRLIDMGCRVVCLDNLLTGDAANIAHLLGHPQFEFIKYDVTNFVHIGGPVDAVLHFASPASPKDYLQFPMSTLKVGSLGTMVTLGVARAKGARYLLASTSEVYGDPLVTPQPETYWGNVNPISPRGVYDEAKRFAEAVTTAYFRYNGLDTRIIRIFNTFGPRMRPGDGRVVSNFIVQALQGQSLTIYGDGTQTRSYSYVEDTVEGIIRILFKDSGRNFDERLVEDDFLDSSLSKNPNLSIHAPVNVGNPQELSVLELAALVLKLTGSSSTIEFNPLPIDDPKVRRPDISKAKALLDWEPKVNLEDGIMRTIEYFRARLGLEGEG